MSLTYTQNVADVAQYNPSRSPVTRQACGRVTTLLGWSLYVWYGCWHATALLLRKRMDDLWQLLCCSGQMNAVAATSDVFRVTGVIVLPGTEAPSAARSPFVMRSYDQELVICRRYWQWLPFSMYFQAAGGSTGNYTVVPLQPMRAAPTIGALGADPNTTQTAANQTNAIGTITPYSAQIQLVSTAAGPCYLMGYRAPADARL